jgi:ribonuclease-3
LTSGLDALDVLEKALGYAFADRALLETALTHASYANENPGETDGERLEFLGDAVIGMVVAQLLYRAHPEWPEGDLTRALHKLVDGPGLASLARHLELGPHIRLGRTELQSGGDDKDTILGDVLEAILGAMYLDGGLAPVEALARTHFAEALAVGAPRVALDPKTGFQEWVMMHFGVFPTYRVVGDSGVEGDDERFTVEILIGEEVVGRGTARSKRVAERRAAAAAHGEREALLEALGGTAHD